MKRIMESKTRGLSIVFGMLVIALLPLLSTVYRNEVRGQRGNNHSPSTPFGASSGTDVESKFAMCHSHKTENMTTMSLPNRHDLNFFLEGPAFEKPNIDDNAAACRFWRDEHSGHFPHAMQQLYRCISYWHANEGMEFYLVIPKDLAASPNPYLGGFVQALRRAMGVRVVNFRGGLRVVRPIVDYGFKNLPNLGFVTHRPSDLYRMRNLILERHQLGPYSTNHRSQFKGGGCPSSVEDPNNAAVASSRSSRNEPTIRILNRRPDHGRTLQNVPQLVEALREKLNVQHVTVLDSFEGKSFEEQIEFMATTDILLSPHGAQLTSIPFLPACASVTEFFPVGYYTPQFFGSLAAVSGGMSATNTSVNTIAYHSLYTGKDRYNETQQWMKDEKSRSLARLFPVCPDVEVVVEHVRQRIRAWQQCCAAARE